MNSMAWVSKLFRRKKGQEEKTSLTGEKISNWEFMQELSPEKEEELINKLVIKIRKSAFREFAPLYLQMLEPFSTISSEFALLVTPYIDVITGINSGEYALLLHKNVNVRKILEKIQKDE